MGGDASLGGCTVQTLFCETVGKDRLDCHSSYLFVFVLGDLGKHELPTIRLVSVGDGSLNSVEFATFKEISRNYSIYSLDPERTTVTPVPLKCSIARTKLFNSHL